MPLIDDPSIRQHFYGRVAFAHLLGLALHTLLQRGQSAYPFPPLDHRCVEEGMFHSITCFDWARRTICWSHSNSARITRKPKLVRR